MNKQLYPLSILFFFIFITIYIVQNEFQTNHYDNGEIQFDYPLGWQITSTKNPSQVIAFSNGNLGPNITINKQFIPPGYVHPPNFIINSTESLDSGFKLISRKSLNLNQEQAYENIYYHYSAGRLTLRKEVWIEKNGYLYSLTYTYQEESFKPVPLEILNKEIISIGPEGNECQIEDLNSNYFDSKLSPEEFGDIKKYDTLVRSFKLNESSKPPTTPFWADVSIPSLNIKWSIRSDTVNDNYSVYHYNVSFYPGEEGDCGLLGHRTLYSAPFSKIDQLKPGDQVIIADYLTQKRYIYQVISNGDIKWDYETDPITFNSGTAQLTLVTCYPPGTIEAAWMVHCKLISIELL